MAQTIQQIAYFVCINTRPNSQLLRPGLDITNDSGAGVTEDAGANATGFRGDLQVAIRQAQRAAMAHQDWGQSSIGSVDLGGREFKLKFTFKFS